MAVHDSFIEVIWIQVYIASYVYFNFYLCKYLQWLSNILSGALRVQVGYASLTCSTKYVCFETLPFENMMKQLHVILIYYS